jgi:acyl-CoA synthetase (AMP-forming)/AMP-acid ligase II
VNAPWSTIPQLVDDAAIRFGDNEAFVDEDRRWTFTQYRDQIHAAARAFMGHDVQPGDRIAVWAPNLAEWAVAALGAHCVGAVLVPVNTRFKGREAIDLLAQSSARILFTVTDFLGTDYVALLNEVVEGSTELSDLLPHLDEVIVLRGDVPECSTAWDDFLAAGDTVDDADRAERSAAVTGDDLCHIMFTSGTTGAPKGAMLRHEAICRAFLSWSDVIGLEEGDRYLVVNPFFHAFGLNSGILACLMKGVTLVPHLVFDVPSVMRRVAEERITMLPGPPAIYQTILSHPDANALDLSSLRLAVTGAAAIPVQMIHDMRERLGFEKVVTGYGLTEASGIATMCRHDDDPVTIASTSGRAIDDVEVRIVDADGAECPPGTPGEVVVRGYNVMVGYLDSPEQTAEAIDADGWLHTGDIGVMDAHGYLDITDRVKDMFINGGFNVYPAEVEHLMLDHPAIAQVAVVGVPDERMGEVGAAFVIAAPDRGVDDGPDPDQIVAWCRDAMANYKVPRLVVVVDHLPMNASGKVLKYKLRDRAAALRDR